MRDLRRSLSASFAGIFVLAVSIHVTLAQEETVKPGINDKYKTADVERTAETFEGEKRDVVAKRDEILDACQLKPGMMVADVGAGTGLFTRLFASKVAPEGEVYAVDITESFIGHIKKTCEEQGIENVDCIVSTPKSAKLPAESVELAFLCDTYHHFEYPFKMLDSIRGALRTDGRLIVIDRKDASDHVRADQEKVKTEVIAAGFKFLDETKVSEKEYLMRFQKVECAGSSSAEPVVSSKERRCLPGQQHSNKLDAKIQVSLDYLLFLPQDYDRKDHWPLMLFLHGAGERGDDLELVKKHGPPKIVDTKKDFSFVLVSPQCKPNRWWQPMELTALLDEIVSKYKVDEDRIYVTGLSMGGFGTWSLAAYTPDRFAAIVPICGGGETYWTKRFPHLPAWVFHGAKDQGVPLERSEEMVNALKKHGGNPRLTVYPEAGHDAWTETYDNTALYEWLLQQKRSSRKPD